MTDIIKRLDQLANDIDRRRHKGIVPFVNVMSDELIALLRNAARDIEALQQQVESLNATLADVTKEHLETKKAPTS